MLILAILAVFFAPKLFAYSLGDINLLSKANEPLNVLIDIVPTAGVESDMSKLSAQLGSEERFLTLGIDYSEFIADLSFAITIDDAGISRVVIQSSAIPELGDITILLRLRWSGGSSLYAIDVSLMNDYTGIVLRLLRTDIDSAFYQVSPGDTLWRIAARLKTDDTPIWKMIDAIYKFNSSAFLDQEPTKIIANAIIQVPSKEQAASQTGLAVSEILAFDLNDTSDEQRSGDAPEGQRIDTISNPELPAIVQQIPYFKADDVTMAKTIIAPQVFPSSERVGDEQSLVDSVISDNPIGDKKMAVSPVNDELGKQNILLVETPLSEVARDLVIEELRSELILAQDSVMAAQMEISALRSTIDILKAELSLLQSAMRLEAEEKEQALAILPSASSIKTSDFSMLAAVALCVVALFLLFAMILSWQKKKVHTNQDLPLEKNPGDDAFSSDSALDIFDGQKMPNEDVFAAKALSGEQNFDMSDFEAFDEVPLSDLDSADDLNYLDLSDTINPVDIKLDLAQTYADLGDISGAKEILEEIIEESNKNGQARARAVLDKLSGNL
ncbi:MAG: FimV/HubP family polar landmark protein [Porticoccaceae bacterium]|nr:FimV/HubP family polar landmark protein [Porticoccaceae bacterium]